MREGRAAPLDGLVREGAAAGLMELGRREAKGQIPSLSHGVEGGCGGGFNLPQWKSVCREVAAACNEGKERGGFEHRHLAAGFLERCEEGQAGAWLGRDRRVP